LGGFDSDVDVLQGIDFDGIDLDVDELLGIDLSVFAKVRKGKDLQGIP